jgi:hypothetical protein
MDTVGDAKNAIMLRYPKLYARFNQAFHTFPDSVQIEDAINQITADVDGWLSSMPENFKTSYHALSRPKFGVMFVLNNEEVRARLGVEACEDAIKKIESQWDECKRKLVVAAPSETDGQVALLDGGGGGDGGEPRNDESLVRALEKGVRHLLMRHYDETIVELFDDLMACVP